jgi:hypothetical protein
VLRLTAANATLAANSSTKASNRRFMSFSLTHAECRTNAGVRARDAGALDARQ